MAIDIDEEINNALNEELDFASLDEENDLDNNDTRGSILVDTYACIAHEIRKNPKFEEIFELVNSQKKCAIAEKYKTFKDENDPATDTIIFKSYALNELEVDFEKSTGKSMNRIDYFTYEIDGVEFGIEDLDFKDVDPEVYDACLSETIGLRRSVKSLERTLKRVEFANKISLRRDTSSRSEEYQLSCLLVDKREKLMDGEAFLKKYDFINSLSDDQSKKLRMIFAKAEIIGNALATLEANGKEQKSLEKGDGQNAIMMDIFEKSINDGVISQEDYDELLEFIADAKQNVKAFEDAEKDDTELGKTIREFVYYIDNTVNRDKEFRKMINAFKEDRVEETEQTPLEFAPLGKTDETEEIIPEKEEKIKEVSKAAEDNLIVSFVLESGKLKRIVQVIKDKEKDLCAEARVKINRELDQAYKDERNATRYVNTELADLSEMLGTEITEENGECRFGDLLITVDDLELVNTTEEQYKEKLEDLDEIVKAEKKVSKDIRSARRRDMLGIDRGSRSAAVDLYLMTSEKDRIVEDKARVEREIKISELFAGLTEEQISRTSLFIKAAQLKEDSNKKTRELTTKMVELEQPESRQIMVEKALVECVKDGVISKEENTELFNFILKIRDGVRSGKYQYVDSYERDNSEDGLVVYDYIGLLDKNIEEMRKNKVKTKDIDDGDRNL